MARTGPDGGPRGSAAGCRPSTAADHARTGPAGGSPQRAVTLSAERRECNPDGTLALRFDWDEPPPGSPKATLTLQKIDLDQTPRDLVDPNAPGGPQRLDPGKLYELSLAAIQKLNGPLNPGERLRLVLHVDSGPVKPVVAQLDITVVEAPVIPTTEAAYALLRRQTAGDPRTSTVCASPGARRRSASSS
ncbi:hypothetical protein ACLQ2P_26525 [Actinomadura citrea]|uniref:hypothetical protein n=1 Tax=Actinomadura citrea TaxID=46158 RepID=UPI003CE58D0A